MYFSSDYIDQVFTEILIYYRTLLWQCIHYIDGLEILNIEERQERRTILKFLYFQNVILWKNCLTF